MNLRGKWAEVPSDVPKGYIKLNVTSAQARANENRRDFSPMTPLSDSDKRRLEEYYKTKGAYILYDKSEMNSTEQYSSLLDEKGAKSDIDKSEKTSKQDKSEISINEEPTCHPQLSTRACELPKFYCFENFWQSGKVFEDIPHETSKKYWLNLNEAKRKYPQKGKKVLYALFDHIIRLDNNSDTNYHIASLNYIQSRKLVYVPEYYNMIANRKMLSYYTKKVNDGISIVVYDFDGPRDNGKPVCEEMTIDLLREKINDERYPFGHGYIVAGLIMGIPISEYIN